jgi:urea transport system permease protein
VGGRALLLGPLVGAVVVNLARTYFTTGMLAQYWLYVLGTLFIAVTLFLPKGIVGTIADWLPRRNGRGTGDREAPVQVDEATSPQTSPQAAE